MVKIGCKKPDGPNTLVSAASVRWRTLAEKVYSKLLRIDGELLLFRWHLTSSSEFNRELQNIAAYIINYSALEEMGVSWHGARRIASDQCLSQE